MLSKFSKDWAKNGKDLSKTKVAKSIEAMIDEAMIQEFEPNVVNTLLGFTQKYVGSILQEAQELSKHADKSVIDVEDVRLAIASATERTKAEPPKRSELQKIADEINAQPLKPIPKYVSLPLEQQPYCTNALNYIVRDEKTERAQAGPSSTMEYLPQLELEVNARTQISAKSAFERLAEAAGGMDYADHARSFFKPIARPAPASLVPRQSLLPMNPMGNMGNLAAAAGRKVPTPYKNVARTNVQYGYATSRNIAGGIPTDDIPSTSSGITRHF